MGYEFHIVDVFADQRFGGNPLAVLPQANGLTSAEMQTIAREFNYSETTFVLPADERANDARVRIFTPVRELPFAGHPNIGTAHVLCMRGVAMGDGDVERTVRFEELAGTVVVRVRCEGGIPVHAELTAPQPLELGAEIRDDGELDRLALALSVERRDLSTDCHYPRVASVGLPFLCVELHDREALARSALRADGWLDASEDVGCDAVHLYTRDTGSGEHDLRCRMYTIFDGVREDPATGSANCALAGLLASLAGESTRSFRYRIAQGIEMGRPSTLLASADVQDGEVTAVRIGGATIAVAEGTIDVR